MWDVEYCDYALQKKRSNSLPSPGPYVLLMW